MHIWIKKVYIWTFSIIVFIFLIFNNITKINANSNKLNEYIKNAIELSEYYNDVIEINREQPFHLVINSTNYLYFTGCSKEIIADNANIEIYKVVVNSYKKKNLDYICEANSRLVFDFENKSEYIIIIKTKEKENINVMIKDHNHFNLNEGENFFKLKGNESRSFQIEVKETDYYVFSKNNDNILIKNIGKVKEDKDLFTENKDYIFLVEAEINELLIINKNDYEVNLAINIYRVQEVELNVNFEILEKSIVKFTNPYPLPKCFSFICSNYISFIIYNNGVVHHIGGTNLQLLPAYSELYIVVNNESINSNLLVQLTERQFLFSIDGEIQKSYFTCLEIGKKYQIEVFEETIDGYINCTEIFNVSKLESSFSYFSKGYYMIKEYYDESNILVGYGKRDVLLYRINQMSEDLEIPFFIYSIPTQEHLNITINNDNQVIMVIQEKSNRGIEIDLKIENNKICIYKNITIYPDDEKIIIDITKYLPYEEGKTFITIESFWSNNKKFIYSESEKRINVIDNLFHGGNGTDEDPYKIACQRHFENIRLTKEQVRYAEDEDTSMIVDHFVLLNDIELTKEFEPFPILKGSLKGANNKVKNICIVWLCTGSKYNGSGLFEAIWGGEVSDIGVEIVYELNKYGTYGMRKGAICGYLIDGTIINCTSKGYFDNAENNHSSSYIGGLVGEGLRGKIVNCSSNMKIISNGITGYLVGNKSENVIIE